MSGRPSSLIATCGERNSEITEINGKKEERLGRREDSYNLFARASALVPGGLLKLGLKTSPDG